MSDTATAEIEVLDITVLPGRGRLLGLAQVEVTLDGVAIVLQGVRILRRADGLSYVEPPCYRHTDGDMVPAVVLPIDLDEAIARAVLDQAGAAVVPTSRPNVRISVGC